LKECVGRMQWILENRVKLTQRQVEVLLGIAKGLTTQEIAGELRINQRTVEIHRHGILVRSGARNSAHAVAMLYRGEIQLPDPLVERLPAMIHSEAGPDSRW